MRIACTPYPSYTRTFVNGGELPKQERQDGPGAGRHLRAEVFSFFNTYLGEGTEFDTTYPVPR